MRLLSPALAVAVLALSVACASQPSAGDRAPRSDRSVLTPDQFRTPAYQNAYDAVVALRPAWLKARGADSFDSPSEVMVYLDNAKLGTVDALRGIALASVQQIRHLDAGQATARWGPGHAQGVVQIITEPGRPSPSPNE
jgi:hypothetical protein